MNGDGRLDALIFLPDIFNNHARLLFSNGDGTFSLPIALPRNPDLIADFDGDGFADFVSNVGSSGWLRNSPATIMETARSRTDADASPTGVRLP